MFPRDHLLVERIRLHKRGTPILGKRLKNCPFVVKFEILRLVHAGACTKLLDFELHFDLKSYFPAGHICLEIAALDWPSNVYGGISCYIVSVLLEYHLVVAKTNTGSIVFLLGVGFWLSTIFMHNTVESVIKNYSWCKNKVWSTIIVV